MPVFRLRDDSYTFPHPGLAEPQGLLAVGGDLSVQRLLHAYRQGIFPWYSEGEPLLWWSPDPRMVLFPDELVVSKSMRPYFNQDKFKVTFDKNFRYVITQCQQGVRKGHKGTWLTEEMVESYVDLHEAGYAHSIEVWKEDRLVGGLYGIALGKLFFGESMFTTVSNASKFGFITMVKKLKGEGFRLIDCQQQTKHLQSMGARPIPRDEFLEYLRKNQLEPETPGKWS